MNRFLNSEALERLRKQYPEGQRVELIFMDDPYASIPQTGDQGTVIFVDSLGTVHINWDCGSTLGAVHGVDIITPLI